MSGKRLSWQAMALLMVILGTGLAGWLLYRVESWPARTAREVRETFLEVAQLQPQVTVQDRVFFEQSASVLELVLVSRQIQVERETEHEWLGSKKRVKLRGVYLVRAGIDLTRPFTVKVEGNQVTAQMPPARVLSVEPVNVEVLALENGIWNRIRASELEGEMRALPLLARQKATSAGVEKEAADILADRLQARLAPQFVFAMR